MKFWTTEIFALCPIRNEIKTFCGPNIPAPTKELAHKYCQSNGLGYLHVGDELVMEIPCKAGTYEPDWINAIDYDKIQNN